MASGRILQPKFKPILLWTNDTPTLAFSELTISGTGGYPYYLIIFRLNTESTTCFEVFLRTITSDLYTVVFTFTPADQLAYVGQRAMIKEPAGTLRFYTANKKVLTETSRSTDNSLLIPYLIYGFSWVA